MRAVVLMTVALALSAPMSAWGDEPSTSNNGYVAKIEQWWKQVTDFFATKQAEQQQQAPQQPRATAARSSNNESPVSAQPAAQVPAAPQPPAVAQPPTTTQTSFPPLQPVIIVDGRDSALLDTLKRHAKRVAASLPVVAPVAIQPALAPPRVTFVAPVPLATASATPARAKKLIVPPAALPPARVLAGAPARRSRVSLRGALDPGVLVDPATLVVRRTLHLLPLAQLVLEKVDQVDRDELALLEGLFSWLLYRNDEALSKLHDLGARVSNAGLKQKVFSYEGWILEDTGQLGLASLALWRALAQAPEAGRLRGGYTDAAVRSLIPLSHRIEVAKTAPADGVVTALTRVSDLSPDARGFLSLLGAERAYDHKAYGQARKLAQSVTAGTGWKEQARYLAAASLIASLPGDAKTASPGDVAATHTAGHELTDLFRTVEDSGVFDATAAMLGRIHFMLGNYKAAHQYLSQVSHETNLFIDAATDNAWALLRSGDRNHAVGNMFTLHTSFFDGAYMPETYFLQTLGYQEICQFGDAFHTLKQFRARYDAAYRKLLEFNNANAREAEGLAYYKDLVMYLSHQDPKLPEIVLRELGRRPEFLRRQRELNDLTREPATAAQVLPTGAPKVNAWLAAEIASIRTAETATISRFLHARALEMQDELKYLVANVSLLEYEVYAGAGHNLSLQGAQNFVVDAKHAAPKRQFEEGQEYWPYEDEIWEDELNNFRSKMVDGCASVKASPEEESTDRAPASAPASGG